MENDNFPSVSLAEFCPTTPHDTFARHKILNLNLQGYYDSTIK